MNVNKNSNDSYSEKSESKQLQKGFSIFAKLNLFRSFNSKIKFYFGFGLINLFLSAFIAINWISYSQTQSKAEEFSNTQLEFLGGLSHLNKALVNLDKPGNDVFLTKHPQIELEQVKHNHKEFQNILKELNDSLQKLSDLNEKLHDDAAIFNQHKLSISNSLSEIDQLHFNMVDISNKTIALYSDKKIEQATLHMAELDQVFHLATLKIDQIHQENHSFSDSQIDFLKSEKSNQESITKALFVILITSSILSLIIGRKLSKSGEALEVESKRQAQIYKSVDQTAILAFTDKFGKILHVNDNFCAISGYSREELIGKDHRILNSGTHPKAFFKEMWQTISSGKTWQNEIQNRSKSGDFYHVRSFLSPIFDVKGEIEQYVAIRFDVTEQKNSENLLKEAEELAKIGSWKFDLTKNEFVWSIEHYKIFEIPFDCKGEDLVQAYRSKIHPEDIKIVENAILQARTVGKEFTYNCRLLFEDGTKTKYIRGTGKTTKDKLGRVISVSGTTQDVTEQVTIEKSLEVERSKSLHSAKLASLGEMSAGIAHEINNPLAIITGSLSVLTKFKDNPSKIAAGIEKIMAASFRIEKIVKGLKKFSRSSATNTDHKVEDIDNIVSEALVLVEAKVTRNSVNLITEIDKGIKLLCDQVELEQVLVNLISNAADAVKSLNERWVKVKCFEENEFVYFQVHDSGSGISDETEKKLFQPFYTTKPPGEGTGLGLAIAKGIVEEHQGKISVNRTFANTCFEIKLPKLKKTEKGNSYAA